MRLPHRFGRYTLVEKIASGGTAEVYRAILSAEEGFEKVVAVKRLLPSWGGNDELRGMLIDEARVLVRLQHQAIAQVFELGSCDGMPFLAMEFIDGIDCARLLREGIRDKTPVPVSHIIYIISQVLTALEFAHRSTDSTGRTLGLVHRDVSPSNILLSWNGEVKVTDFGIAKGLHRTRETRAGELKGKYAYMAPEQARGQPIDARADIFACGIVFYELLSASRLFDADTDMEVLENVKCARLPDDVVRGFPPEIRAILLLALSCDPASRYQSAAEMLGDLQRYARGSGEITSSLELASFLRQKFLKGDDLSRAAAVGATPIGERKTKAWTGAASGSRYLPPKHYIPIVGTGLVLIAIVFMVPQSFDVQRQPSHQVTSPMSQADRQTFQDKPKVHEVSPSHLPGASRGAVAVDSTPTGAKGAIVLGNEKREVVTPFSIDEIAIGDGLDGRIEVSYPGFETVVHSFRLTPEKPALVRNFNLRRLAPAMLSVNARPWGLVDIQGFASGKETPLSGLKVKAGAYMVKVRHPPTGQVASARVVLSDGESKNCLATFGEKAQMSCR